jgi:iron complex outermembrane receptor protein
MKRSISGPDSGQHWLYLSALGLSAFAVNGIAFAQESPAKADDEDIETVTVTGSLLPTDNTTAPTPLTVASSEQLVLAAPRTMTEALLQLPVFKGSPSVASQGTGTTGNNAGAYLNLRGLGTQRTLVLLDGRRVVAATAIGSVDVAIMPEALVKSVDVVTGGASAAYGSDAVAGVVNYRLDTKLEGLKFSGQYGITDYNDNQNYKFSLAGGTSFFDDRMHFVGSVEYYDSKGVELNRRRPWAFKGLGAIPNPNVTSTNPASPTNPRQLVVVNPYSSVAAQGGLITNTALRGTTFDPDGNALQFQYGDLVTSTLMRGGAEYNPSLDLVLQPAQTRSVAFGHLSFDVNDNMSLFLETNLARNEVEYNSLPTFELSATAFTVFRDNAYLPDSVSSVMNNPAALINSVTVGRISPDIAIPHLVGVSNTQRFVGGIEGTFNEAWSYRGYYQHGENHSVFKTEDDPISNNLYRAVDAVESNGKIVCRSTLTDPTNGCVPLNIFGVGAPSDAARAYIVGTAVQDVTVKQDVAEATVIGRFGQLQGGQIGMAFGVGYRKEQVDQTTDAISQTIRTGAGIQGFPAGLINTLGGFERTNPQPTAGEYNVKEGFAEIDLPLLEGKSFAESLNVNAAVRYTDYSNSGGVTTWKGGFVYEPFRGYKLRATRSRDIRAPTLGELFQGSSQGTASIVDPFRAGATGTALTGNIGNTTLTPEEADTTVIGIVLEPEFAPGFTMSIDYYDIKIADAIATLTAQQIVDACFNGATDLCQYIQRDTTNAISRVRIPFLNVAERTTAGYDVEVAYTLPLDKVFSLGGGSLTFRLLGNQLDEFNTQVQGAPLLELAGDIGINSTPKYSGVLSARLVGGPASFYIQARYIGSGKYDNTKTTTDLNENYVGSITYTDSTLTYNFGEDQKSQAFFSVNNLFDRVFPQTPGILISASSLGNRTLYDVVGRSFSVGLRHEF